MIIVYQGDRIRIKVNVFKGRTNVLEDFSRANVKVFLRSAHTRSMIVSSIQNNSLLCETFEGLEAGVYDLKVIWVKNGKSKEGRRVLQQAEVTGVFAVTDNAEEATNLSSGQVLRVDTRASSYGYDGLDAYELAVLRGKWSGTEEEWLTTQRNVQLLPDAGDSETDTMTQKAITELVNSEKQRAEAAEQVLHSEILSEKERAERAEFANQTSIASEKQRAIDAERIIHNEILKEKQRAENAEAALQTDINKNRQEIDAALQQIGTSIDEKLDGLVNDEELANLRQSIANMLEMYEAIMALIGDGYGADDVEDYIGDGTGGGQTILDIISNIQAELENIKQFGASLNAEDKQKLEDARAEIERIKQLIEEKGDGWATAMVSLDELKGKFEVLAQAIVDGTAFQELNLRMDAMEGVIEETGRRVDTANETITGFSRKMDAVEGSITDMVEKIDAANGEVTTLKQEMNATKGTIETLASKTDDLGTKYSQVLQSADEIKQTVAEVKEDGETRYSQIDQKVDSITQTVAEQDEANGLRFSQIEQTAGTIQQSVADMGKRIDDITGEGDGTSYYVTQSQLTQTAEEINASVEEKVTTFKGEIEETYTTKGELSVKADEIKSSVKKEITDSVGNTYATKGELTQTAEALTSKYTEAMTTQEAAERAMANAANGMDASVEAYQTEIRQTAREISLHAEAYTKNLDEAAKKLEAELSVMPNRISASVQEAMDEYTSSAEGNFVTQGQLDVTARNINASVKEWVNGEGYAKQAALDIQAGRIAAVVDANGVKSGVIIGAITDSNGNLVDGIKLKGKQVIIDTDLLTAIANDIQLSAEKINLTGKDSISIGINDANTKAGEAKIAIGKITDGNGNLLSTVTISADKVTSLATKIESVASNMTFKADKIDFEGYNYNNLSQHINIGAGQLTGGALPSSVTISADHFQAIASAITLDASRITAGTIGGNVKISGANITIGDIGANIGFKGKLIAPTGNIAGWTITDDGFNNAQQKTTTGDAVNLKLYREGIESWIREQGAAVGEEMGIMLSPYKFMTVHRHDQRTNITNLINVTGNGYLGSGSIQWTNEGVASLAYLKNGQMVGTTIQNLLETIESLQSRIAVLEKKGGISALASVITTSKSELAVPKGDQAIAPPVDFITK